MTKQKLKKLTNLIFAVYLIASVVWITWSYAIATYSTIAYGTAFPLEDLSINTMTTVVAVVAGKVLTNIFEHSGGKHNDTTDA